MHLCSTCPVTVLGPSQWSGTKQQSLKQNVITSGKKTKGCRNCKQLESAVRG